MRPGDEVVDPGTPQLAPGQIRDCNRAMLLAAAAAAGAEAVDLGIAQDVMGHLEGAVDSAIAAGADVLVTSGVRPWFVGGVLRACTCGRPTCAC
jgi:gephyrin